MLFSRLFFFSIYFFIEIYVVVFLRNVTQDARDVHRRQVNVRLRRGFVGSLVPSASLGFAVQSPKHLECLLHLTFPSFFLFLFLFFYRGTLETLTD